MRTVDVVVLGGGTAGTAAARAASDAGGEVVMFNDSELGGLCILRGCMPTKTLLHAAHAAHEASHGAVPGIAASLTGIDFDEVMANKRSKVARFQRAKVASIDAGGYELVRERARFTGPDRVEAGGETFAFRCGAVIATGSKAFVPEVPGLERERVWTSDEALEATAPPASLAVVGSGAVGLELAQFFARMGTQVTLISRTPVLSRIDAGMAREMAAALDAEPQLELMQPARIVSAESVAGRTPSVTRLTLDSGGSAEVERVLFATGRYPDLGELGLSAANVEHADGKVAHGDDMRTSNPRIFVAGDATGGDQLLHVANIEGRAAGLNALAGPAERGNEPLRVCRRLRTTVVFTDPPAAWLGETAAEVRARGVEPLVAVERMAETGRAITMETRFGVMQLVADPERGEILGAQILGPRADDLIHIAGVAMTARMTAAQLLEAPWYHPTLSEVYLSLLRQLDRGVGSHTAVSVNGTGGEA